MAKRLMPTSLRYVEEVARRGSIQQTARELNVAASAIDRHLLMLEAELGVKLFERMPRGMRPTVAGDAVAALARRWRADVRRITAEVQNMRGADRGHVRLAAMDSHANGLLPALVLRLARDYPQVTLEIDTLSTDEAATALIGDRVEVVIAHNLPPNREIRIVATEALPFGCVVAPGHELARLPSVTLQAVAAYPIALQSRALMIRRYLDANHAWLFENDPPPIITNSLQLVKSLARSGQYVVFTSELDAAAELIDGSLRFIPIRDRAAEPQSVSVALAARKAQPVAQLVAEAAAEEVILCLARLRGDAGAAKADEV